MTMTKTNKMATISNGHGYIERRVFEDHNGVQRVRISRDWYSLNWLRTHGNTVHVWF